MRVIFDKEVVGEYTHWYVHGGLNSRIYIGITNSPYRLSVSGQYKPVPEKTVILYVSKSFTEDGRAFLPGEITVETAKLDEFMQLAGKWYLDEFLLYSDVNEAMREISENDG